MTHCRYVTRARLFCASCPDAPQDCPHEDWHCGQCGVPCACRLVTTPARDAAYYQWRATYRPWQVHRSKGKMTAETARILERVRKDKLKHPCLMCGCPVHRIAVVCRMCYGKLRTSLGTLGAQEWVAERKREGTQL